MTLMLAWNQAAKSELQNLASMSCIALVLLRHTR